jgi:hypothetical protein
MVYSNKTAAVKKITTILRIFQNGHYFHDIRIRWHSTDHRTSCLPFLWHIQQHLPNVPPPSTSTPSSSDVFCLPGAVPSAQALDAGFSALKLRFNRTNATRRLWLTTWHWVRFSSVNFGFPLSVSFHQRFSRIFTCQQHYIIVTQRT